MNRRVFILAGSCVLVVGSHRTVVAQAAPQRPAEPASTLSLPATGVDVPLRLVGGRPLVTVQVNGKGPYTFLIDTGAAGQARADTSLVEALKLEVIGEARGSAGTGGQVVLMPIVRFDTLQIGEATISAVTAPSRDYNTRKDTRIDGILGISLFKDCLVTLDFERGRLRLERGSLPAPDGREVFAFTNPRGVAELPIRVGDNDLVADVDTGAMGGITVPLSLAATLSLASPPVVVGRAVTVSGPMEISAAPLKGAVTIGRYAIADPTLEFTPSMPHGNLGIDVLSQFGITFDQQNRRLRLSRSSTEPIRVTKHR